MLLWNVSFFSQIFLNVFTILWYCELGHPKRPSSALLERGQSRTQSLLSSGTAPTKPQPERRPGSQELNANSSWKRPKGRRKFCWENLLGSGSLNLDLISAEGEADIYFGVSTNRGKGHTVHIMIYSDTSLEGRPLYNFLKIPPCGFPHQAQGSAFRQPIVRTALPRVPKPHCLLTRAASAEHDIRPSVVIGLGLPTGSSSALSTPRGRDPSPPEGSAATRLSAAPGSENHSDRMQLGGSAG